MTTRVEEGILHMYIVFLVALACGQQLTEKGSFIVYSGKRYILS